MPLIETERLIINPIDIKEASFIVELLNSPKWIRYIGKRDVKTVEDAEKIIVERYQKHFETHGFGVYTLFLKETNQAIGLSTLLKKDYLDAPDIGYALLENHQGKGYATEASKAVYHYAQTVLGMTRIVATTTLDNDRSIRVLEKLGFSFEKTIENEAEGLTLNLFANVMLQI